MNPKKYNMVFLALKYEIGAKVFINKSVISKSRGYAIVEGGELYNEIPVLHVRFISDNIQQVVLEREVIIK